MAPAAERKVALGVRATKATSAHGIVTHVPAEVAVVVVLAHVAPTAAIAATAAEASAASKVAALIVGPRGSRSRLVSTPGRRVFGQGPERVHRGVPVLCRGPLLAVASVIPRHLFNPVLGCCRILGRVELDVDLSI